MSRDLFASASDFSRLAPAAGRQLAVERAASRGIASNSD
jgi:hypothetical protein